MNQSAEEKYLPSRSEGPRKPRILVAALDWGLGHATRCIPVIDHLLSHGAEVWLAGEGAQMNLLESRFPSLNFLELKGYRVKYSGSSWGMVIKLFRQSARILSSIKKEHAWLENETRKHGFDAVISDNRFGLYHSSIPTIFITHQLAIRSSIGKWIEGMIREKNYRYINCFRECWVPDFPGIENLGGQLSHPGKLPLIPVRYIGMLSRFQRNDVEVRNGHLVFILSGPEPQRTMLENKIVDQVSTYAGTATIIRGLPGDLSILPSTSMLRFYNHLPDDEMSRCLMEAEFVICRSGYSSIMDLIKLGKKMILVPTPGQTEQEYLGKYMAEKKLAVCILQKEFSLQNALQTARQFNYAGLRLDDQDLLEPVISNFLSMLAK